MNIVKFQDIVMTPEVLKELGYIFDAPGYWVIGEDTERFEVNPLPVPRSSICMDFELAGVEGTWNKDIRENPDSDKPTGRNVGYYGIVVSGGLYVYEQDTEHYGEPKHTYTVAIQVDEDHIEDTMVTIGFHEFRLAEVMDGTPESNPDWAKALYVTFPTDRTNPNTITLRYPDGIEERYEVVCEVGEDDGEITELGGTNIKFIDEPHYCWTDNAPESLKTYDIMDFCDYFNSVLRNKYAYAIHWEYILPMINEIDGKSIPVGDPFNPGVDVNYVNAELGNVETSMLLKFTDLNPWIDQVRTLGILQNDKIKYDYLNEFTPDDDITIEELKVFRTWLASILLANTPVVNNWTNSDMLITMLTYYKQNMQDTTTGILAEFARYMDNKVLVTGTSAKGIQVNLASIDLSSGCGCFGGVQGVGNVSATTGCDPLQIYRNAIYNYMVETFSNVEYWMEQVEICVEMRKYLEGILKVGLPLGSKIIDQYADCGCNTLDSDSQVRYRKMIEALIQSLTYIIEGNVPGNRNYVATAFANWATYLYEYMYWI